MPASRTPIQVTVLHVEDCPSVPLVLERLRVAADLTSAVVTTTLHLVTDEAEAVAIGFRSSPTVLVDGNDPFDGGGISFGCRLYQDGGRLDTAPTVAQLASALGMTSSRQAQGAHPRSGSSCPCS